MYRIAGWLVLLLCVAAIASAQTTRLGPTSSLQFNWPAATSSPDTLDAPDGYRVKAVSETQSGVVLRSWDTAASVRTLTLTPSMIPDGLFRVSVHPFNVAGEAPSSNLVGPFGKAVIPMPLTGVTAGVVGAP
jgi:hypothetical protein